MASRHGFGNFYFSVGDLSNYGISVLNPLLITGFTEDHLPPHYPKMLKRDLVGLLI